MKRNRIFFTIINYLFLAFMIIIFFGSLFLISASFGDNGIKEVCSDKELEGANENMYFSFLVFYSVDFGNMIPNGFSRVLVIIEVVFSFIIHIVILGIVISRLSIDPEKKL